MDVSTYHGGAKQQVVIAQITRVGPRHRVAESPARIHRIHFLNFIRSNGIEDGFTAELCNTPFIMNTVQMSVVVGVVVVVVVVRDFFFFLKQAAS